MTSFLKKPMVDATPRDLDSTGLFVPVNFPQNFWEATTKHPNWLLLMGSKLLGFYKVKTENLGCVLCKTKKDLRIKHTHTQRKITLYGFKAQRGALTPQKMDFCSISSISFHSFPCVSTAFPCCAGRSSSPVPCQPPGSPVSSCRPWKCEFQLR